MRCVQISGAHFRVNAPQGSLPLLVKARKGGLRAWMNAAPETAPAGSVMLNLVELISLIGIRGVPSGFSPPRLTTVVPCALNRLMTVRVEKPAPSTVNVVAVWTSSVTLIRAPSGTETALLLARKLPPAALLTIIDPGPVGVVRGKVKVIELDFRLGLPGARKVVGSLPPTQAQNTSTAAP